MDGLDENTITNFLSSVIKEIQSPKHVTVMRDGVEKTNSTRVFAIDTLYNYIIGLKNYSKEEQTLKALKLLWAWGLFKVNNVEYVGKCIIYLL